MKEKQAVLDLIWIDLSGTRYFETYSSSKFRAVKDIRLQKATQVIYCVSEDCFYLPDKRMHSPVGIWFLLYLLIALMNLSGLTSRFFPIFSNSRILIPIAVLHSILSFIIIPPLHQFYYKRFLSTASTVQLDHVAKYERFQSAKKIESQFCVYSLCATAIFLTLIHVRKTPYLQRIGLWDIITILWVSKRAFGGLWLKPIMKRIENQVWPVRTTYIAPDGEEDSSTSASIYDS